MHPPDFERLQRAYAFIATEMYRATPSQLGEIESDLARLMRLIEAYRRVMLPARGDEGGGAAHLAGGAPAPFDGTAATGERAPSGSDAGRRRR